MRPSKATKAETKAAAAAAETSKQAAAAPASAEETGDVNPEASASESENE